jgi:hypothetical protein
LAEQAASVDAATNLRRLAREYEEAAQHAEAAHAARRKGVQAPSS